MDDPDGDQDAVRPWLHDNRKMRSERNFLEKINYEKLWTFTDWDPLLGCVPVQTSKTLSGLLTGMNLVLKKKGVPFNLVYDSGKNRLVSLDREDVIL